MPSTFGEKSSDSFKPNSMTAKHCHRIRCAWKYEHLGTFFLKRPHIHHVHLVCSSATIECWKIIVCLCLEPEPDVDRLTRMSRSRVEEGGRGLVSTAAVRVELLSRQGPGCGWIMASKRLLYYLGDFIAIRAFWKCALIQTCFPETLFWLTITRFLSVGPWAGVVLMVYFIYT